MTDSQPRSPRILLVDDEEDLVTYLAHRLLKKGFTVTATTSGADALAAVERQTFDVAIIDLKMPQMDGIEVLARLKAVQPFLEAIMLTGHGSTESALEAGQLQAFRYLIKPYDYDELLALINAAHTKKREELAAKFQAELQKVVDGGETGLEIAEATEKLRREYEQD
jgi:DNA-binding NtrC family response regulator